MAKNKEKKRKDTSHQITITSCLFVIALLLSVSYNTVQLYKKIASTQALREKNPYTFRGIIFAGLEGILKGTHYISYYTDKDLDERTHALQFAQAQYTLAPVILDSDNLNRKFILFDCTSEEAALMKMKEIGVVPLRKNQFGIILARNPKFKEKK